jgi:2-polyprenyl-3-methyl-5-hydroxy-6-metoxy-1,4-benzoquinol methylase
MITETTESATPSTAAAPRRLSARLEPFDSYWQAPDDVEKGYTSFVQYYKVNFLPRIPERRDAAILVVSCGPGYLVKMLVDAGYTNVLGIDSDPAKVAHATNRGLPCRVETGFEFLEASPQAFDVIVCEQELNHLTKAEMIEWLVLCRKALRANGTLVVYGLNGANPITAPDALSHNLDHFHTFTDYSLLQALELGGFREAKAFPLELYVFYGNPLNYVGLAITGFLHFTFRMLFRMYGKKADIFTKKLGAVARKPGAGGAAT